MEIKNNTVVICGDIHGKLRELVWKLTIQLGLTNTTCIVAGDCGIGFMKEGGHHQEYMRVKNRLEKANVEILLVRGNHDDPEYFEKAWEEPRLKCLPSWTTLEFPWGSRAVCIGGATSSDKSWRLPINEKKLRNHKTPCWWESEGIIRHPDLESLGCPDYIISHTAPISFPPILVRPGDMTENDWNLIRKEREYLDDVLERCKPEHWWYGHFHNSYSGTTGRTLFHGLSELEITEIKHEG